MNCKIIKFDPYQASEELWDLYFDFGDEIGNETEPERSRPPRTKRKKLVTSSYENPEKNSYRYLLLLEESKTKVIGQCNFTVVSNIAPAYETNKKLAQTHISILSGYRRHGFGSKLLELLISEIGIEEPTVTELIFNATLDCGKSFLTNKMATVSQVGKQNRLYLNEVDWKMVQSWVEVGSSNSPTTQIHTVSIIPEAIIEKFCTLYSETSSRVPLGDISNDLRISPATVRHNEKTQMANEVEQTTMYTQESDGKLSGVTEIFYQKDSPDEVHQNLTGVGQEFLGHGLGKWLKANMLLFIKEKYPQVKFIVTGNADSNAPMNAINQKLGFKNHKSMTLYKLKI
ncbi:MAG: hypothetical protein A2451_14460 [Bdellovibrionales bacterium RIFOXYC2_FULL_39_8]|nr:MAG: hypothetical protein A2404_02380 [Bdellovibrionales bacterium RIFOXYC1_FULL_39_130]OFZ71471.1 MAG: hypothetical protein A2451_14460 [Bdellovibrionales bacterium RIFOXYC2_FULL_39_8]OFZ75166.1 MAG: hypothetical protein A2560_03340 [Bdellovibrionales bacterium RIFOXYD1_FULL_39_84]HLE12265.1 hypothetical protein [Bacteriovoracaceae bacterium]